MSGFEWLVVVGLGFILWAVSRITDDIRAIRRIAERETERAAVARYETEQPGYWGR